MIPEKAIIDGIERSAILPEKVTNVIPHATIPSIAIALKIFIRFLGVRNSLETSMPAIISSRPII
jgi:hypothetical protein